MCTETENNKLPNYRIYDRTGGGVTEDIYAASLADAIEHGREWIEEGNWGDNDEEEPDGGKTYRTIELECSVYKIVRVELDADGGYSRTAQDDDARYTVRAVGRQQQ
jgi:hypothetical protein